MPELEKRGVVSGTSGEVCQKTSDFQSQRDWGFSQDTAIDSLGQEQNKSKDHFEHEDSAWLICPVTDYNYTN